MRTFSGYHLNYPRHCKSTSAFYLLVNALRFSDRDLVSELKSLLLQGWDVMRGFTSEAMAERRNDHELPKADLSPTSCISQSYQLQAEDNNGLVLCLQISFLSRCQLPWI